jgi:polyribonucleotide nucleotidyltransferase
MHLKRSFPYGARDVTLETGEIAKQATAVVLHISQIAEHRVESMTDVLAEGQSIRVKVLETDDRGRIRLSMKAVLVEAVAPGQG